MVAYIKSDLYRYTGKTNISSFIKIFIISSAFRLQVYIRMCKSSSIAKCIGLIWYYLFRIIHKNLQISYKCDIGYGLYIGHDGPVVISRYTKIGDNCNLSQFTTIGTNNDSGATIGNNVYIGPNTCIVGAVEIGNNVTIGAGSVVTKNIPDNATAAGNYAKVLNFNNPGRFIHNIWKG